VDPKEERAGFFMDENKFDEPIKFRSQKLGLIKEANGIKGTMV